MNTSNAIMDTLSILERLESAGFDREQATVLAKEISHAYDYEHNILATKENIEALKNETHNEFGLLRKDIKESELRLTNKLGVIIFLSITAGPAVLSWISKLIEMASR